jgi:DNA-binding transcriptional regulator YhcF (GntR family)
MGQTSRTVTLERLPDGSPRPPYLLAFDHVCRDIAAGRLRPGDQVPVRLYRDAWGIAYATVASTMRELQQAGIVYTEQGYGTFVTDGAPTLIASLGLSPFHSEQIAPVLSPELTALEDQVEELQSTAEALLTRAQTDAPPRISLADVTGLQTGIRRLNFRIAALRERVRQAPAP